MLESIICLGVNSFLARGYFCYLLKAFVNSLDPDQDQQNTSSDLDPNHLTVLVCSNDNY